ADGRVIKLYPKVGGHKPFIPTTQNEPPANAPSGPKSTNIAPREQVVDGKMGFPESATNADAQSHSIGSTRLYSDNLERGNRSGSGIFQRGPRSGR
ncbi:hypothetical protein E4U55_002037, partial [Claviceps digitariae]